MTSIARYDKVMPGNIIRWLGSLSKRENALIMNRVILSLIYLLTHRTNMNVNFQFSVKVLVRSALGETGSGIHRPVKKEKETDGSNNNNITMSIIVRTVYLEMSMQHCTLLSKTRVYWL